MADVIDDRTRMVALLRELDLKPVPKGQNGVQIQLNGLYATLVVYGDGTLSLVCSVRSEDMTWDLARINAANNRVRFAKFSVEHGDLMLKADFVFQIASPVAVQQLRQLMALWRLALHELHVLVEELVPA